MGASGPSRMTGQVPHSRFLFLAVQKRSLERLGEVNLPGTGVYEFDPVNRKITAARIYFDVATLLKQISAHQPQVLQQLLMSWFASRAVSTPASPVMQAWRTDT